MSIEFMLLLLVVSFLLLGGLIRFAENVIRPAPTPLSVGPTGATDGPESTIEDS